MGRRLLVLTAAMFCLGVSACEKSGPPNLKREAVQTPAVRPSPGLSATPVPAPSVPKDGDYDAKGEVTKINLEIGSVEVKHENIEGLMPPMQMEFYVKDKEQLKDLKVGDRVDFVIEYRQRTEVISKIKKAQ